MSWDVKMTLEFTCDKCGRTAAAVRTIGLYEDHVIVPPAYWGEDDMETRIFCESCKEKD